MINRQRDNGLTFVIVLLSIYIFVWYIQLGKRIEFLGSIRIGFILGAMLFFISLNKLSNLKGLDKKLTLRAFYLFFTMFIYTVFTFDPVTSKEIFIQRVVKFSAMAYFIAVFTQTSRQLNFIILGYMLAMLKIIQEGYYGIITGGLIWENQGIPRLHGVTPLYRHPNSLSGVACCAMPFFLHYFKWSKVNWQKFIFLFGVIGLLLIILYTGSRTGYLAILAYFALLMKKRGLFKFKTIFIAMIAATVAFQFLPESYKGRFATIFASTDEDRGSSAVKRMEILKDASEIFIENPLGVGVSAFPAVREEVFGRTQDTHNLYLEVLTNLGVLGGVFFILLVLKIIKTNKNSFLKFKEQKHYRLADLCLVVNYYIYIRLFLGFFGMDLYEIYWWFALGITLALNKLTKSTKEGLNVR